MGKTELQILKHIEKKKALNIEIIALRKEIRCLTAEAVDLRRGERIAAQRTKAWIKYLNSVKKDIKTAELTKEGWYCVMMNNGQYWKVRWGMPEKPFFHITK